MKYPSVNDGVNKNNPLTIQEIKIAADVLGCSDVAVQETTTRTRPDAIVAKGNLVDLPTTIMLYYGKVEVADDMIHVNRMIFLISLIKTIQ